MAKVAFVFPGQGSQAVGMGRAAHDNFAAARQTYQEADTALNESLSTLCFDGPAERLQLTANTQPAILTTSVALLRALDADFDLVAGHSLGEYSANVAAGTLTLKQAVALVRSRGTFMQEAVPVNEGSMAAIGGGDRTEIERVCAATSGVVEPVNYNRPGQLVIAGQRAAVADACGALAALGARVTPLEVSAPFHCSLMRPAEQRLDPLLRATQFAAPKVPIYVNVSATAVTDGDAARSALIRQVSRPVLWDQVVAAMIADGAGLFVEVGPGSVLTGLIGRIARRVKRVSVESPDDFEEARAAIAEARAG